MRNLLFLVFFIVSQHCSNAQLGKDAVKDETASNTTLPVPLQSPQSSNISSSLPPTPANSTRSLPVSSAKPASVPKLICYYDKLSVTRPDKLKYSLENVNSSLCTHLIYSFITLDPVTLKIQNDSLTQDYESVLALKDSGIIVMVSLGGRNDSLDSEKYSKMVRDANNRKVFVDDAVHFLTKYKFQGLDLSWDYPTCWSGYCKAGRPADRGNFGNLARELHIAFSPYKLLLSVAVSPLDAIAEKAYNIPQLAQNVDWINLMTFDYNNMTFANTSIHSPFNGTAPSTVSTVDHWKLRGVHVSKLVLGIPTFGRTFTLGKDLLNSTGSPATIGKPTQLNEPGLAAYFEICKDLNYQYLDHVGPYAYAGDQWVSFDDITNVKVKGEFVRRNGLGGALIYTLDMDDFSGNYCKQGVYPLVNALRSAMFNN